MSKDFSGALALHCITNFRRFLGEFYNNSRLHHISTMGANFKRYVNELREKSDGNFPKRSKLSALAKSNFSPFKKVGFMAVFEVWP